MTTSFQADIRPLFTERDIQGMMKGFNLATGEIQGWLCSDDVIEPDAIREVLDYFQEHPQDQFIYGDALFINREGQVFETKREIEWNSFVWLHDHNYIRQPSAFWRKTLYEKVGGINPELKACMDPELFSRFALVTRPVHVRGIWSRLRMYPEIKSFRMREAHEAVQRVILSRFDANYRWPMQRPIYWAVAKGLRTYFKIQQHCYSDSHFSQLMCLFSKRRWKEMSGVWDFTADSNR